MYSHKLMPLVKRLYLACLLYTSDIEAVNRIVRHYSGFIASRSMRPMKDEYGNTHMVVDETLRRRMETRLIAKILSFEIRESN